MILEALELPFFQRALMAGLLVSVACGVVGTYVVVKGFASISGGLAHATFGGLGLGYLGGFSPMAGAAGFGLFCGLGLGVAHRRLRQGMDTLVMIVWSVGMALGILLVAAVPGYTPDLTGYLFGNLLLVSPTYLWLAGLLNVALLGAVAWRFRELQGVAFDEEFSEIVGVRVDRIVLLLMGFVALVVVVLIRVVGVLLAIALLTIPAALARQWTRALRPMMAVAATACAVFVVSGLFLTYGLSAAMEMDVPTGPVIVLLAALGYGLSTWFRKLRHGDLGPGLAAALLLLSLVGAPSLVTPAPMQAQEREVATVETPTDDVRDREVRQEERPRVREAGIRIGAMEPGPLNALTDVEGVRVGHHTIREGDSFRTGVTAVLPHDGNLFREKVPAAVAVGNGFGKLVGLSQVQELGELETPVLLTGTLSVFRAADALVDTLLRIPENRDVRSINPVVGETNDGYLSDIRARPVQPEHVRSALRDAAGGPVEEGSVGAGTGTRALGWKGGIGTASRTLPEEVGGYTLGVLVQTNYGGDLRVGGIPVWRELSDERRASAPRAGGPAAPEGEARQEGGSVMIVVATDAPLASRELERVARRAFLGIARTGSWMSHGSGDYSIAFSTDRDTERRLREGRLLSALFRATVEATEEAVLNSLFRATTVTGHRGRTVPALPVDRVLEILERKGALDGTSER